MSKIWLLLMLTAALTLPGFGQDPATEEKALREMWNRFEELFNKRDAKGVAGLYAPDGDRINPQGEVARGRAEVQKQYEAVFAELEAAPVTIPFHAELAVRFLRSDVALLDGKWEVDGPDGKVRGHFTVTATKEEGRWWIAAGRDRGEIQQ